MSASIDKLPESSIRALRSAFIITTYASCVEELVQNAIDASASSVSIYLRKDQWSCRVHDNGKGIRPEDLAKLGQRYFTSKAYTQSDLEDVHTFGFRGEALASLAESSVVEVLSRHEDFEPEQTHAIHLKRVEQRSSGPVSVSRHFLHAGTVISVRDLFFKWPVRRKTGASSMETIRRTVELLALLHPHISFSIVDLETPDNKKVLSLNTHGSVLDRFRSLFGRSLVQDVREFVKELLDPGYVSGFVSLSPAVDKQYQSICINGRPVQRGALHQSICEAFDKSNWMSMTELNERQERTSSPYKRQRLQTLNPRKGLERHPVFVLHLHLPVSLVDVTVEPSKKTIMVHGEDAVASALYKLTVRILREQGYTVKTRKPKAGLPHSQSTLAFKRSKAAQRSAAVHKSPPPTVTLSAAASPEASTKTITWVDPDTGLPTVVDARTGNAIQPSRTRDGAEQSLGRRSALTVDRANLVANPDATATTPAWMTEALTDWRSSVSAADVHPLAEQPRIPVIQYPGSPHVSSHTPFFHSDSLGALDRAHLKSASVVAQLDDKFIVLRDTANLLHLVDQHAASERLRVERYLRQLCSLEEKIETVSWEEEPRQVLIFQTQCDTAVNYSNVFQRWGFTLMPPTDIIEGSEWQTFDVSAVPRIVESRLRAEPHLLQSLITSFLSQLQERPQQQSKGLAEASWLRYLGDSPRVLLHLVNSKACRGAIMFGDKLDLDQCERLVAQLGETCFPFQCAHGRPSVVPLTTLDPLQGAPRRKLNWNKLQKIA